MIAGRLLRVEGRLEREGRIVHLIAEGIGDLPQMLLTQAKPSLSESGDNQRDAARHPANTGNRPGKRHPGEQVNDYRLTPVASFRGMQFQILKYGIVSHVA